MLLYVAQVTLRLDYLFATLEMKAHIPMHVYRETYVGVPHMQGHKDAYL